MSQGVAVKTYLDDLQLETTFSNDIMGGGNVPVLTVSRSGYEPLLDD